MQQAGIRHFHFFAFISASCKVLNLQFQYRFDVPYTIMAYLFPIRRWAMDDWLAGISRNVLENAIRLAKGRLDIVIVLLEPIADEGSFENMMRQSKALQEIKNLIEEVSNGRYSSQDVSILDVRLLISKTTIAKFLLTDNDLEAAYDVFQKVVEMKRPRVILTLQCQTSTVKNELARKVCSKFRAEPTTATLQIQGSNVVLIKGFHPSTFLNYTKSQAERSVLRQRLWNSFKTAFESLEEANTGAINPTFQLRLRQASFSGLKVFDNEKKLQIQCGWNVTVRPCNRLITDYMDADGLFTEQE